jgi:hypothetical protein
MVAAKDPNEAYRIRKEIVRGFYGGEPNALALNKRGSRIV